jgi:hypothetical protein
MLCYDRVASESDSKSRVLVTEQSAAVIIRENPANLGTEASAE